MVAKAVKDVENSTLKRANFAVSKFVDSFIGVKNKHDMKNFRVAMTALMDKISAKAKYSCVLLLNTGVKCRLMMQQNGCRQPWRGLKRHIPFIGNGNPQVTPEIVWQMMKYAVVVFLFVVASCNLRAQTVERQQSANSILVRISEIEVYPQFLEAYLQYAYAVGAASVQEEPGVICIYPMQMKRDSCQIRILEIYKSNKAYQKHIKTAHFQKYKTETLQMVKSLDLVDMNALDPAMMPRIFKKMSQAPDSLQ